MLRGSAHVTFCAIALPQSIVARKRIIWIVQQCLKLTNCLIPATLLLIQPPQKVASIRSIKAIPKNLFTEIDSIGETTLGLKGLSLSKHASNLASCFRLRGADPIPPPGIPVAARAGPEFPA